MQELQDDFGLYPNTNTRFNSTIIDDDENLENCQMEDDDSAETFPTHSVSSINEKCLLDELLQTEEVDESCYNSKSVSVFCFLSSNVKLSLFINNYVHCVWN